jgi:hypothetical protein
VPIPGGDIVKLVAVNTTSIFNEPGKSRVSIALGLVDSACAPPAGHRRCNMKLDAATFVRLRRLAPVLDDVLNAGGVEHADQAVALASLAQLCAQLFDAYHCQHRDEIAEARLDALESQSPTPSGLAAATGIAGTTEGTHRAFG